MDFLGIGTGELLVILVVALMFVGPEKMVGAARKLGQLTRQITQAGKEFSHKLEEEVGLQTQAKELRKTGQDISNMLNERITMEPETPKGQTAHERPENRSDSRTSPEQTNQRQ